MKLKLSQKLPMLIIGLVMVAVLSVSILADRQSSSALIEKAEDELLAMADARRETLSSYLDGISQDLRYQASSPMTLDALRQFTAAYQELGANAEAELQRLYIDDNPHPTGEKEKLDAASDGSTYSTVHQAFHPSFRKLQNERSYYDVFLLDADGNLIYSVFKELDYATNLMTGQWKDTDLGNIFRAARQTLSPDHIAFHDFSPYPPSHDAPASFIASPVLDERGQLAGVMVIQMPIGRVNEIMQSTVGMGETGETYIIGDDLLMRSDSRFSEESTLLKTKVDTPTVRAGLNGETGIHITTDYRGIDVFSAHVPISFHDTHWVIMGEMDEAEVLAPVAAMRTALLITSVIAALLIGVAGLMVSRSVSRPISAMTTAMRTLANGDKTIPIPSIERHDEIGDMARAVQVFKDNAVEADKLAIQQKQMETDAAVAQERQQQEKEARQQAEDAEQEQRRKADEARAAHITQLTQQFDLKVSSMLETVAAAATELEATATALSSTAEKTTQQASTVANASEQATNSVQGMASAAEELSASVSAISQQVAHSSKIAANAVTKARQTNETVKGLAQGAEKIGNVLLMISEIASQTNLLALNATIESARAGEAGKGFAVVASEVKILAQQTGKATEDISEQIHAIQEVTTEAVNAIGTISTAIEEINETATAIATAMSEQDAATGEISRSAQSAADGTTQVTSSIAGVSDSAGETGTAASHVLDAAKELATHAESLRAEVDEFIHEVQTAQTNKAA